MTSRMQIGDAYPAASDDMHDIIVRNVRTYMAGGNHTVRLLNHDGIKLYNIAVSDIYDMSVTGQIRAAAGLKIGDAGYSTFSLNQLGETYNIFATNINSRATSVALIQGTLKDAVLCDLNPFDGAVPLTVGTMPTQNVVVCQSPAVPSSVQMNDAVLEVDISPSTCDTLTINGDLTISGNTHVEVLTTDLAVLQQCKDNKSRLSRCRNNDTAAIIFFNHEKHKNHEKRIFFVPMQREALLTKAVTFNAQLINE